MKLSQPTYLPTHLYPRCKLGQLTLFEWYKYVEVGSCCKNPSLPAWVICSESHFTVLFALDSRPLKASPPFDLLYYDGLSKQVGVARSDKHHPRLRNCPPCLLPTAQESLIKLSIKTDQQGGWTGRVGDSFGDRGKCEGQNIPPLECVIETRWPGVVVDWNGADPIL